MSTTFIFYIFLSNGTALNWLQHVVGLSVSLTMSGSAERMEQKSMSRLDFLNLVLQSSKGSDLISLFFQVMFSLVLTVYEDHVQLMLLGSLCSTGFFWRVEKIVSVLFIVLNLQIVFRLKPMFSKGPSHFIPLFVIMGLRNCACPCGPSQRQWQCHGEPNIHKSWTRQDWTS